MKTKIKPASWENAFNKVLTPFEEFISRQTTGGFILMICTIIALILANSPLSAMYTHWTHIPLGIHLGPWQLEKSLQHWINEALMVLFFLIVGLELKREILIGDLSDPKVAALPLIGALGGMLIPALIYTLFNFNTPGAQGWGIPMATDIAFAVSILVMLGKRIPRGLILFLLALAIGDDLGAVLVIALFYTGDLQLTALMLSAFFIFGLIALNLLGFRRPLPYFIVCTLLWFSMLQSGIHATLAGVFTAFVIPAYPRYDPFRYSQILKKRIRAFDLTYESNKNIVKNQDLRGIVQSIENSTHLVQAPLQRLEHNLHLPVTLIVIPLFAIFNAGVVLNVHTLSDIFSHPITIGVSLGLIIGKFAGITGFCWLAIKLGVARLPQNTTLAQLAGVSLIAGIGFTMSLFIAELAFSNDISMLNSAKTGILLGSLLSGVFGIIWLRKVTKAISE